MRLLTRLFLSGTAGVLAACGGGGDGPRISADVQAIAFAAVPAMVAGEAALVRAAATSGLAVRYSSLTPTLCTVDAASGAVQALAAGACIVAADQAGDSRWAPAPQATQTLFVSGRTQRLAFEAAPPLVVGGRASVQASASSGLAVRYSTLSPAVCTVQEATGRATGVAVGTCTIAADQDGDAQWSAAAQARIDIVVAGQPQTLAFAAAPALQVGSTARVSARASSGLAVHYRSLSASICRVDAGSGLVTALAGGTCTIAADQPGDGTWAAADPSTLQLEVAPRTQTLAFDAAPAVALGQAATLHARASSGLAVAYTSLSPAVCQVTAAGIVTVSAAGLCTVAADQPGNADWAPAPQALLHLSASGTVQTLRFAAAPSLVVGASARVKASASSGLAVRYASLSAGVCSVDAASGTVSGLAVGSCTIAADQAGDATWAPAPRAMQAIDVLGRPQTIAFATAPALAEGGSARLRASASSGLPVRYASQTPAVCSIDAASGLARGLAAGRCTVSADQAGDATWAAAPRATQGLVVAVNPVQTIAFGSAPRLTLGGSATVSATSSAGLAVRYTSLSSGVCSVQAGSGLVSALALGDCVIAADQPGDADHQSAPRVTQTLPVQVPDGVTVPGVPQGVSAVLGNDASTVLVGATAVDGGGLPVSGYTVVSSPAGVSVSSATLPVSVRCPARCAGLAFSLAASNGVGRGAASAAVDVLTLFDIVVTFREPDTQPRDTVFHGSFTLNSTRGTVSGLAGELTESMTGSATGTPPDYGMTRVALSHQLKFWTDDTLGGRFVAAFAKDSLSTFTTLAGGDGWSPQAGIANGGLYAGFPAAYAGTVQNSSVLVFVPDDPFAPAGAAQIARLAYADCAPGGMMGAVCMTGTHPDGYGSSGTMSGYPVSQVITRRSVPPAAVSTRPSARPRPRAPAAAPAAR